MPKTAFGDCLVFSARAEVFREPKKSFSAQKSFLRASGGVSSVSVLRPVVRLFSPRERRCFYCEGKACDSSLVFSARAEVFPGRSLRENQDASFLRASGGVSTFYLRPFCPFPFSPRERRCFYTLYSCQNLTQVFSARAEVFPWRRLEFPGDLRFLRASGGVSTVVAGPANEKRFSPRERRCF